MEITAEKQQIVVVACFGIFLESFQKIGKKSVASWSKKNFSKVKKQEKVSEQNELFVDNSVIVVWEPFQ